MSDNKPKSIDFPAIDLFNTDRFFDSEWFKPFSSKLPPVNIKETEKGYKVELAVPGFKKEDIKVNLEEDVLTVSAEMKEEKNELKEKYTRKEFSSQSFSRSFKLPSHVSAEGLNAKYDSGVLHIEIPASKETSPKKKEISIN